MGRKPGGGPHWWKRPNGYIDGRVWENGRWRRVKQHRWIMEQHIGRRLRASEVVHHLNGKRDDNRIGNLELMTDSAHKTHHYPSNTNLIAARGNAGHLKQWTEENGGPWNKGKAEIWEIVCSVCGKRFRRSAREVRKRIKKGNAPACSPRCVALIMHRRRREAAREAHRNASSN